MRVLISMPEKFLEDVDKAADYENRKRSELIRVALVQYMKKIDDYDKIFSTIKG